MGASKSCFRKFWKYLATKDTYKGYTSTFQWTAWIKNEIQFWAYKVVPTFVYCQRLNKCFSIFVLAILFPQCTLGIRFFFFWFLNSNHLSTLSKFFPMLPEKINTCKVLTCSETGVFSLSALRRIWSSEK